MSTNSCQALKRAALLRLLRIAHGDGLLLELSLRTGESFAGYWLTSVGPRKIRITNSTMEEIGEEEIVFLDNVARVELIQ